MNGAANSSRSVWVHEAPDPARANQLAGEIKCPLWFASFLIGRGISDADSYARWTSPKLAELVDPFALPDMDKAVDRILHAIQQNERITIFGDYDVDGISASALMLQVFSRATEAVCVFLPQRLEEGYGLSIDALKRCLEETRPNLIITVDCGTSSSDAVLEAKQAGVDVVITDHHALASQLAPAVAVVNPRRSNDEKSHVLAGVGVAFKVCHALLKRARALDPAPAWAQFDLKDVLDLVALGTVVDMVPLLHENRIFVSAGLREINRSKRPGIAALCEVAGVKKTVGTYDLGFLIGPRLNASGRLGTARASLDLLAGRDPGILKQLASELNDANRARQDVEKATVAQLLERIGDRMSSGTCFAIVEADREWHPGVVGLAATRATQKYGRPSIVIGSDDRDRAKGSGRSIPGFNLVEALEECREHLVKFGGHAMAAGVEVLWENIEAFRMKFELVAHRMLKDQDLTPRQAFDGWISPPDVCEQTMRLIEQLEPYGMGHPEPVWGIQNLRWARKPREAGKGHLQGSFEAPLGFIDMIGFGLYRDAVPTQIDALCHLRRDDYMGRKSIKLHVKDFRPADRPD